jgi:hypothetical protein
MSRHRAAEPVALTAVGYCGPGGALSGGALGSALVAHAPLAALPGGALAGIADTATLRRWLVRKKDRKLLARAAELALCAFGPVVDAWPGPRESLGLFVGVGREPPDDGESEAALAASASEGRLDEAALALRGRDLYPPLLPLKTLPNLVLAHVSINFGIGGPNNAVTGAAGAGLRALVQAIVCVQEGRAPAAVAGAADSQVDLGSARDRLRLGASGPPGEAACAVLVEPLAAALARGAAVLAVVGAPCNPPETIIRGADHHAALGDLGVADGAVAAVRAVLALGAGAPGPILVTAADPGLPAERLVVGLPAAC